ncbi:MAG: pseudouridine synthase [Christensenellales bacterium]
MRINKYLALCGIDSRRKVEQLILDGKIKVNGKVVTDLSTDINENKDEVLYLDKVVKIDNGYKYYMLNKPKGYVTTVKDELNRRTVMDLVADVKTRIFPVGRLDYNTEGLLIMTNDGELAERLTKPNYAITKTYVCVIKGKISESELAMLRAGAIIDGEKLNKCKVKILDTNAEKTRLEIVIDQGKNRQIRKMLEYVHKEVVFLKRVKIGDLKLGGLSRGKYRELKDYEIQYLYGLCNL